MRKNKQDQTFIFQQSKGVKSAGKGNIKGTGYFFGINLSSTSKKGTDLFVGLNAFS